MTARLLAGIVLAAIAAASGWWVYHLSDATPPPVLIGPPRSDYVLEDFELVALGGDGREAFFATGPRLTRHPHLATLDVEQPRFSAPDAHGGVWTSRADRAHVERDGSAVHLLGTVEIRGPTEPQHGPIVVATDALTFFPGVNRVRTERAVTVTEPGSILRATGLEAELDARRFQLLANVRIRHDPVAR